MRYGYDAVMEHVDKILEKIYVTCRKCKHFREPEENGCKACLGFSNFIDEEILDDGMRGEKK